MDECATSGAQCGRTLVGGAVNSCADTSGGYACTCGAGFVASGSELAATCINVDECATASRCGRALGGGAVNSCTDSSGGYACACGAGFAASGSGLSTTCVDVNECIAGTHDCDTSPLATCVNTGGSFTCACPPGFTGDGHGTSGCGPRFTDLGGGLVRDNNGSGLVWQQTVDAGVYTQAEAIAYCASLTLDGGGWRLPTIDELMSIVDTRFWPKIDPTYFPGTPGELHWSSVAESPSYGYVVDFFGGWSGGKEASFAGRARCVR
jgi:hypothetical protein